MYTRCPSCRAEISFEPPANAESLPDGYKHKIKCPSCGVTIGVRIPKTDSTADIQPTFTPANPNAVSSEPVFVAAPPADFDAKAAAKAAKKGGGRAKSAVMFIFSLLIVAVCCLGYLVNQKVIEIELLNGLSIFDGITPIAKMIENMADVKATWFDPGVTYALTYLLPSITFVLAGILAVVSLICCFVGKYSRVFGLIFGLLVFGGTVCTVLQGFFIGMLITAELGIDPPSILDYLKGIIEDKNYLVFVGAGLGLLTFVLSLSFLGGKKKVAED